jgi:hypothetical protein
MSPFLAQPSPMTPNDRLSRALRQRGMTLALRLQRSTATRHNAANHASLLPPGCGRLSRRLRDACSGRHTVVCADADLAPAFRGRASVFAQYVRDFRARALSPPEKGGAPSARLRSADGTRGPASPAGRGTARRSRPPASAQALADGGLLEQPPEPAALVLDVHAALRPWAQVSPRPACVDRRPAATERAGARTRADGLPVVTG